MSATVRQALAEVCARSGLHGEDLADMLSVDPATVARWMRGEAAPDLPTRAVIGQLHFIVERLAARLTPAGVCRWLHDTHPALKDARAVDLIRCGRTADVLAAIETLDPDPLPA